MRRMVLLRALRPDLEIEPLRGNLDTRLRKLDDGQYSAIVLASAGLKRLGLASRVATVFEPREMLPAAGQGALGIEIRTERVELMAALVPLAHQPSWLAVTAERAVSRAMGGSCSMPLAAHATWAHAADGRATDTLDIEAAWGEVDAALQTALPLPLVRATLSAQVTNLAQASQLGEQVAALLMQGGAKTLRHSSGHT